VNPRASRTVPYVSKATGVPLEKSPPAMTGRKLREFLPEQVEGGKDSRYRPLLLREVAGVSVEQFRGGIRVLVRRLRSTGEVMGVADNFGEALRESADCSRQKLPIRDRCSLSVTDHDKPHVAEVARRFCGHGVQAGGYGWHGGRSRRAGLSVERVYKVKEGRPNVVDLIKASGSSDH